MVYGRRHEPCRRCSTPCVDSAVARVVRVVASGAGTGGARAGAAGGGATIALKDPPILRIWFTAASDARARRARAEREHIAGFFEGYRGHPRPPRPLERPGAGAARHHAYDARHGGRAGVEQRLQRSSPPPETSTPQEPASRSQGLSERGFLPGTTLRNRTGREPLAARHQDEVVSRLGAARPGTVSRALPVAARVVVLGLATSRPRAEAGRRTHRRRPPRRSDVTVCPPGPASRHCLGVGAFRGKQSRRGRVSESRTVSPTAIVRFPARRGRSR